MRPCTRAGGRDNAIYLRVALRRSRLPPSLSCPILPQPSRPTTKILTPHHFPLILHALTPNASRLSGYPTLIPHRYCGFSVTSIEKWLRVICTCRIPDTA